MKSSNLWSPSSAMPLGSIQPRLSNHRRPRWILIDQVLALVFDRPPCCTKPSISHLAPCFLSFRPPNVPKYYFAILHRTKAPLSSSVRYNRVLCFWCNPSFYLELINTFSTCLMSHVYC